MTDELITFTRLQFNSFLHYERSYSLNSARNIGDIIEGDMGDHGSIMRPTIGWVYLNTQGDMVASIEVIPNSRTVTYAGKTESRDSYRVRLFKGTQIRNDIIEEKDFDLPVGISGIDDVHGARGYVRSRLSVPLTHPGVPA